MNKVYLGVNGPKWLENLMTEVYLDPRGEWSELGREFADTGVPCL